jgi:hypothetical protein
MIEPKDGKVTPRYSVKDPLMGIVCREGGRFPFLSVQILDKYI